MAAQNVEAFATAAQGGKADTAMQRIAELTAKEQSNENNILFNWGGAKNLTAIAGGTTEVANS